MEKCRSSPRTFFSVWTGSIYIKARDFSGSTWRPRSVSLFARPTCAWVRYGAFLANSSQHCRPSTVSIWHDHLLDRRSDAIACLLARTRQRIRTDKMYAISSSEDKARQTAQRRMKTAVMSPL